MRTSRLILSWFLSWLLLQASACAAAAETQEVIPALGNASISGRILQTVAILSVLAIAPSLLVMTTSFTRFVVALSFLRSGLGLQNTPGNMVLVSLALFLTALVMAPNFEKAWNEGVQPLMERQIDEKQAAERIIAPFREFMVAHVRESDLQLLRRLQARGGEESPGAPPITILAPAFMMSELRRGFEIGFLIALPFLVIDLIVATITMSMGMMMLPPSVISLPVKVLFFVVIDGWSLLVGGLVRSFG